MRKLSVITAISAASGTFPLYSPRTHRIFVPLSLRIGWRQRKNITPASTLSSRRRSAERLLFKLSLAILK